MSIKLNKHQLNTLATVFGIVAGVCPILVGNGIVPAKWGGTAAGIATVLLGYVTQKPAKNTPTTEDVEEGLDQ